MTTQTKKKDEGWLPFLLAGIVFILLMIFHSQVLVILNNEKLELSGLYAAIFDWSAIQTGFLFAVYGFVAGKKDGFVGAIATTAAMRSFASTLKKAVFVGFLLTLISMPLIAYPLKPAVLGYEYLLVSFWFCLFVWAFILFLKVAYTFGIIVRVPDNKDRLAH